MSTEIPASVSERVEQVGFIDDLNSALLQSASLPAFSCGLSDCLQNFSLAADKGKNLAALRTIEQILWDAATEHARKSLENVSVEDPEEVFLFFEDLDCERPKLSFLKFPLFAKITELWGDPQNIFSRFEKIYSEFYFFQVNVLLADSLLREDCLAYRNFSGVYRWRGFSSVQVLAEGLDYSDETRPNLLALLDRENFIAVTRFANLFAFSYHVDRSYFDENLSLEIFARHATRTFLESLPQEMSAWVRGYVADYSRCSDCEEISHSDFTYNGPTGLICESCANENYRNCFACEEFVYYEDTEFLDDEYYCSYCAERYREERSGDFGPLEVSCYSYKPSPNFHYVNHNKCVISSFSEVRNEIFMGVELENHGGGNYENNVAGGNLLQESGLFGDRHDFLYAKSDCSVAGPEIVSHPATLEAHKKLWADFPFESLVNNGWRAWANSSAGLHVHISREAFGKDELHRNSGLARFAMLFGGWEDELVSFGGRNVDYARHGHEMKRNFVKCATGKILPSRNSAINYANLRTVEIRMFRASLKYSTLMAYLEFLDGLVRYTREISAYAIQKENAAEWNSFVSWLEKHDYPFATNRIQERI